MTATGTEKLSPGGITVLSPTPAGVAFEMTQPPQLLNRPNGPALDAPQIGAQCAFEPQPGARTGVSASIVQLMKSRSMTLARDGMVLDPPTLKEFVALQFVVKR